MSVSTTIDWNALRETEFPVARRWAYFDHAAVSPLPRRSGEALRSWAADQEQNGDRRLVRTGTTTRADPRSGRPALECRSRRDRLHQQHDPRDRPDRRRVSLAPGRQRGRTRRGIPVEHLSLDEPSEPGGRAPPGRDPRRPHPASTTSPRPSTARRGSWRSATSSLPADSATIWTRWPSYATVAEPLCSSMRSRAWARS